MNAYFYYLPNDAELSKLVVSYASLKATSPKYDICCMVSSAVSQKVSDFLIAIGISVLDGTCYDDYLASHTIIDGPILSTILYLQYEKIVYIDYNTYVMKNIDCLFDKLQGSMYYNPFYPSTYIGIFVYNALSFTNKEINEILNSNTVQYYSTRAIFEDYYKFQDRPDIRLPIEFCTNIFDMGLYKTNPLFNFSHTSIWFTIHDSYDITQLTDIRNFDITVQQYLYDYLKQYDLIITLYQRLYPEYAHLIAKAAYEF